MLKMTLISSLGLIGSFFSDNQYSWQRAGVFRAGEDGRGAGGVGEESQGGTLGCLGTGEQPGDSLPPYLVNFLVLFIIIYIT